MWNLTDKSKEQMKEIVYKEITYIFKARPRMENNELHSFDMELSKSSSLIFWIKTVSMDSLEKEDKRWSIFQTLSRVYLFILKEIEKVGFDLIEKDKNLIFSLYLNLQFGDIQEKAVLTLSLQKEESKLTNQIENISLFIKELFSRCDLLNDTMNRSISKLQDYKLNNSPYHQEFNQFENRILEEVNSQINSLRKCFSTWLINDEKTLESRRVKEENSFLNIDKNNISLLSNQSKTNISTMRKEEIPNSINNIKGAEDCKICSGVGFTRKMKKGKTKLKVCESCSFSMGFCGECGGSGFRLDKPQKKCKCTLKISEERRARSKDKEKKEKDSYKSQEKSKEKKKGKSKSKEKKKDKSKSKDKKKKK
jgi:hypothetical protein